jgi:isoleucyl-tRNA synthetase
LISPIAPFFAERLFKDLNSVTSRREFVSVHLCHFPQYNTNDIDLELEERMQLAQKISSMVLSLRKKTGNRVRQPLQKILIPLTDNKIKEQVESVQKIILAEVNVKNLEFFKDDGSFLVKKVKADFKKLGPKFGKQMKELAAAISNMDKSQINLLESEGKINILLTEGNVEISKDDVEIITEDIPGWVVMSEGSLSVALDVSLTDALIEEGVAREFVNRIQNLRKERDYEVTDKIRVFIEKGEFIEKSITNNYSYICNEILATELELRDTKNAAGAVLIELTDEISVHAIIEKV